MAEFQRMPTQEELQRILFMSQTQGRSVQDLINENLAKGSTVKSLPDNFFTTASAGAKRAGEYINRAGTAADVAKLFPGYQPETKVTIPTSFSVVPKVDPYSGQVMPTGIQTQQAPIGNVLQQIKPADVLGVSGAERAYGDIGAGKAPQPFDVIDTLGVGAAGMAGAKGLLGAARATKGLPVGMSIQDVTKSGLLATAPKSEIGFYSAVENAALASPRKTATGQAFLNDIMKGQDVRADEIKWMGLDDYLKDKKSITKQEVQDYIANNRVDVQEVRLGESVTEDPIGIAKRKAVFDKYEPEIQARYKEMDNPAYVLINRQTGKPIQEFVNNEEARKFYLSMSQEDKLSHSITPKNNSRELQDQINEIQNLRDAEADAAYVVPESLPTKFGKYTLPGGENYREILLTMPTSGSGGKRVRVYTSDGMSAIQVMNDAEIQKMAESGRRKFEVLDEINPQGTYQSSHFDQPNILAHLRVNDRVDADGKKMLLIEEVQSDWHQAGREKGYKTKQNLENWYNENKLENDPPFADLNSEQISTIERNRNAGMGGDKGVPDAPFKDTWYQLALKRAIQHAAENGYDRIGLTTGSQQAARFDLSKQLSRVSYQDGTLQGYDPSGALVMNKFVDPKDLSNYVGKELASKMVENAAKDSEIRKKISAARYNNAPESEINALRSQLDETKTDYSGLDLQVGGEGMKKYYDEIYPKFLDKYGKKWGAKVGETKIRTQSDKQAQEDLDLLEALGEDRSKFSGSGMARVRYIDITPEMKAGVSKGQPLFAAAPIGVTGGLLGTQQDQRK